MKNRQSDPPLIARKYINRLRDQAEPEEVTVLDSSIPPRGRATDRATVSGIGPDCIAPPPVVPRIGTDTCETAMGGVRREYGLLPVTLRDLLGYARKCPVDGRSRSRSLQTVFIYQSRITAGQINISATARRSTWCTYRPRLRLRGHGGNHSAAGMSLCPTRCEFTLRQALSLRSFEVAPPNAALIGRPRRQR